MTRSHHAASMNMQAFAVEGKPLTESTLLSQFARLALEQQAPQSEPTVNWSAGAELRPASGAAAAEGDVWLHLKAKTALVLSCQRCMGLVETPIEVDQWYRFVASEEIAMQQDDDCEEDLLVMEPHFDLLAVLEDELLMALPLVPMHETCPRASPLMAADSDKEVGFTEKPNPFAVLARLKKS